MTAPKFMFWDSCVFIRYLVGDASKGAFFDICRFVDDAKAGECQIYFSTLAYAEIRQEHFEGSEVGNINEMFEDFGSSFTPIDPNPNILITSGELRSAKSTNPGDPRAPHSRAIGTADAIHLMTCLYARDVMGVSEVVFHTFDEGKGKTYDGRTVPIIGFESWFPSAHRTDRVKEVCGLSRLKPSHPQPTLEGIVRHGISPRPQDRA